MNPPWTHTELATLARQVAFAGCFVAVLTAAPLCAAIIVHPSQPNILDFPAQEARFVRFVIHESTDGQPCLDELEVYGSDSEGNMALATRGAKATASSSLSGYAIHQVQHLNDGQYGNGRSWIAAGAQREWAQIELPQPATIARVVFSRDREGRYSDRLPAAFEVRLSLDGAEWSTVFKSANVLSLPPTAKWDDLLRYAFLWEQRTWSTVEPADPVTRVLKQFEEMIERFAAKGMDVSSERTELAKWRTWQNASPQEPAPEPAYLEVRLAKRQLFLRAPELRPLERVLFVQRHPYEPSHNYSDLLDAPWRPGGGVSVLEIPLRDGRMAPHEGSVKVLFDAGNGVARDPMAGFDARQVYFAHRDSPDGYFHLFQMNADGTDLRRLTEGPFHDVYPCPLPDGGLAFISTRCKARFLCWRPQAYVLFRMDAEGENIWPLSYANLSEWGPSVMRDGRIIWTRSEYLDKGADFGHTLWAIRPDGTHAELLFGNNTRYCYMSGREVPGTGELCATLISHGGDLNGPIALIDPEQGRSNPGAVTNITPDSKPHFNMNWAREQCFRDPVPIARDYFLVSHAPRRHFGIYVIDRWGNRELIHLDPAISSMSPSPLQPTPVPPVLASIEPHKQTSSAGEFMVEDVYAGLGESVERGSVKYLRVSQELRADLERLPTGEYRKDHPPFEDFYASPTHLVRGPHGWPSYVAKATLGLVPIDDDGSARFEAPSGKVLYFHLLDEKLNELQRMRSVVQLQPGERRSCIGCHEDRRKAVPVRQPTAMLRPPRAIESPSWGAVPFSYEKVVQPVWDNQCVRCHNGKDHAPDLTGTLGEDRVPASYRSLITQGWVHYFDMTWSLPHHKAEPTTFGTLQSKLWQVLEAGHYDVELTWDEMHRLKAWIDLNCPLWPDYQQRQNRPAARQTAGNPRPARNDR
jgi:hypothetical protein